MSYYNTQVAKLHTQVAKLLNGIDLLYVVWLSKHYMCYVLFFAQSVLYLYRLVLTDEVIII